MQPSTHIVIEVEDVNAVLWKQVMLCRAVSHFPSTPSMQAVERGVWVSINITLEIMKRNSKAVIVVCSSRCN